MSLAEGSVVYGSDGRTLTLARLLASGGAGSIHLVQGRAGEVAKIYHAHVELPAYQRRIKAMLELAPQLPDIREDGRSIVQLAWPTTMLADRAGRFVGFAMPAVDIGSTTELERILQARQALAAGLPTGLGAKVTLAANLAAVLAELHRQGHYVVDLKPVNLRFYRHSLYMAMLDCDGFSIQGRSERFNAPQFTPDYLAPEFQAGALSSRGEHAQDCFAFAVIAFQLLNFGIHPYSGRPSHERVPTDLPGRIAGGWYPFGLVPKPGMAPNPGSGHQAMPHELRRLFDRAFSGAASQRPSATEWAQLLADYARRASGRLVVCTKEESHQHFSGQACASCARGQLLNRAARAVRPRRPAVTAPRKAARARPRLPARPTIAVPRLPRSWPVPRPSSSWFGRMMSQLMERLIGVAIVFLALWVFQAVKSAFVDPEPERASVRRTSTSYAPAVRAEPPLLPPTLTPAEAATTADVGRVVEQMTQVATSMGRFSCSRLQSALADLGSRSSDRTSSWARARQSQALSEYLNATTERHGNEAARTRLREALGTIAQTDPYAVAVLRELGWMSLADGRPSNAQWDYARALLAQPADAEAWYGFGVTLGDHYARLGAFALAEGFAARDGRSVYIRRRFVKPQTGYMDDWEYEQFLEASRQASAFVGTCPGAIAP